jgi:hypothetical protein
MEKLYVYNSWHNGDVITNRCLIQKLIDLGIDKSKILLASYQNRHYLVEDLPINHFIIPTDENSPQSPCLCKWCPYGYIPVNTWCGTYPEFDHRPFPLGNHNWANIVDTWNKNSDLLNLNFKIPNYETPMVKWEQKNKIEILSNSIYVETGHVRSDHCRFEFDIKKLSKMFKDLNFICTSKQEKSDNVFDMSDKNLIEMSHISNQCLAIIGKGSGPFMCTLTEENKFKPKAVIGFTAAKFWHYENNPLQYLNNEEELIDFLRFVVAGSFKSA